MGIRSYLGFLLLATAACWAGWLVVVFRVDPTSAGVWDVSLFYGGLSLSLLGTFALTGLVIRRLMSHGTLNGEQVATSFRQALLFVILLVGSVALLRFGLLNPLSAVLFVAVLATVEFFFSAHHPS